MQKSMSTRKKFKISLTVPLSFLVNENHNFKDFIWIEHLRYGIYMFFLVNSMKLRKKNQTGEKKSALKKIRRPQKSKFWKIQLTKVWYYQNETFVSCVFWYMHFCGLVIFFNIPLIFFYEFWIILAFEKNKWLKLLYIQTSTHILKEGCYSNKNIRVWPSNCTYKYFYYTSIYQAMI